MSGLEQPLVFVKTHKVGGTSLRLLLERNAQRRGARILNPYGTGKGSPLKAFTRHRFDEVLGVDYLPKEAFPEFDVPYEFSGAHLPYDRKFFDYMVPGARFVTLLRDPLQRAVSHFYYHGGEDFDAWFMRHCEEPGLRFAPDNTRVINYFSWWLGLEEEREMSRALLEQRFLLVGLQERFAQSVALLGRLLGWPVEDLVYSYERRVGQGRARVVSEETATRFRQLNARDYALFELARELLEEKIASCSPGLGADVQYLERNVQAARI